MKRNKEKTFTFKYDPVATPHQMFNRFWEAVDTGKKNIQPKNIMIANKVETIYRIASPARLDLLNCVAKKQPLNIQELSQLLHRDYANVWRDTQALASLGVIELRRKGQEVQPISLYDRIVFDLLIVQKETLLLRNFVQIKMLNKQATNRGIGLIYVETNYGSKQ